MPKIKKIKAAEAGQKTNESMKFGGEGILRAMVGYVVEVEIEKHLGGGEKEQ